MLIWNEKDSVKYGDFPDQSQSFRYLLARAIAANFARHQNKLRYHWTVWPWTKPWNHLYEQFASYISRNRINGSFRVLCKPRLIFSRINGHISFVALYATTIILYAVRCLIGSHCSWGSTGVICYELRVLDTRRAALFCTDFSLSRTDCGNPYRSALQKSSLDEIKARTSISASSWDKQFPYFCYFPYVNNGRYS